MTSRLREESKESISEMKRIHTQEKNALEERIEKLLSLMRENEKSSSQVENQNKATESSLISEVHVLKTTLEGERKKSE